MAKTLSAEQYLAIEYLALPKNGGKSQREIAEICGVHWNTISNWKKDPYFEAELKKQIVRNTHDKLPKLFESMMEHAINDGNAAMAKLILTANDMLTDKVEVTSNESGKESLEDIKAKINKYKGTDTKKE